MGKFPLGQNTSVFQQLVVRTAGLEPDIVRRFLRNSLVSIVRNLLRDTKWERQMCREKSADANFAWQIEMAIIPNEYM
jgi:uncharacterized protein (DUF2336 family)